ncbi:HNH endonuclease [Gordonia hydrophobica]|uniref:HNH endonuclease n=1 Tax=Gordonia hydrophobica TaxID=40516 RepID=A0ABZ2U2P7_9ACTN|nr:HNH endonuclease [Gordonia hydrophobica]MBM7369069.1 5-methylcytosine-specific restriction protein A [Gordonia hydrophobica]
MKLSDLTVEAVNLALDEFDLRGRDGFLSKYHYGPARAYFVVRNGTRYDSKAVVGAAYGYLPGQDAVRSNDFSGGDKTVATVLRKLGFEVQVAPTQNPDWARDELILACDLVAKNGWRELRSTDDRVGELSALLQQLPLHPPATRLDTFRNRKGVARKTLDLASLLPGRTAIHSGKLDLLVLNDFRAAPEDMARVADQIRQTVADGSTSVDLSVAFEDEDEGASEGRILQRQHFARERDRKLRQRKINDFKAKHDNQVYCEVCLFDFGYFYGARGRDYIEVHHVVPLSQSGETTNRLKDLVLLCANCHRMIHRRSPWLKPDELRALIGNV